MTAPNAPMSAEEALKAIDDAVWFTGIALGEKSRGFHVLSRARTAVAAMAEREAALVAERDALRKMWTQAESDIAALRADAERYRWLRSRNFGFAHDEACRGIATCRWGYWPYDTDEGHAAVMDAAIDAARN